MNDYIYVEEKLIDKLEEVGITNGKTIMLYAKIQAMAEGKGYTTAGNPYFCRILNIVDRQARRYLNELEGAGCITRFEKRNGAHTDARLIYPKLFVTEEDEDYLGQNCPERTDMTNDPGQECPDPGQKRPKPRTRMSKTSDRYDQNPGQKRPPVIVCNKSINSTRGTAGTQSDASLVEVADAPDASLDVASAPDSADAARLRLPYNGRLLDKEMPDIILRTYQNHLKDNELDDEEIYEAMVKEFTSGFYCCDEIPVKKACSYVCGIKLDEDFDTSVSDSEADMNDSDTVSSDIMEDSVPDSDKRDSDIAGSDMDSSDITSDSSAVSSDIMPDSSDIMPGSDTIDPVISDPDTVSSNVIADSTTRDDSVSVASDIPDPTKNNADRINAAMNALGIPPRNSGKRSLRSFQH